jgi:hypothetical protein
MGVCEGRPQNLIPIFTIFSPADLAAALVHDLPPDIRNIMGSSLLRRRVHFQNPAPLQIETPGSRSDDQSRPCHDAEGVRNS